MKKSIVYFMLSMLSVSVSNNISAQRIQQTLGRGVVAVKNGNNVLVSWRRLAQEPENIQYNIYVNGTKKNTSPINNTNYQTNTSQIPIGSDITVTTICNGVESAPSVSYKLENHDIRNMFLNIRFDESPLKAAEYGTAYVWPADLDGDGEMDYIVNRKSISNALDCYVEAYLRTGEYLWTVKLGPNELSCAGQDDMILAYDMDCDGKSDVVMQTSDGTQFWDAEKKTFGLFVNGSTTGDTDNDGIINYESQSVRNAPRYMTVVDGLTGKEKCSVEQTYNSAYNRTNKSSLMGDEYNKHVGHVGVFYHDGIHPAVIMEWHTRNSNGGHNYYNSAFAFDFTTGKAGEWKELFCKPTGGPAFHQIRIADVDGDGKDEMQTGGYTMNENGSTLNTPKISHGDRFRTSDIDPSRPGLETFAIQQDAGDMLGQILYDAATGEAIKKWYLSSVGDVGRGECMDIDPNHWGWEMWSTMGGVYNAKGDLIPEHTAPYPTEGIWWDGDYDREIVNTSDSHYNVYVQDFFKGRLIEIAKLSGWRYQTVYAKRAAFWGDIIGDWREELILLNKENDVCVGIVGFATDMTTDIDNIYCLQEDPAYRLQCTTKGYYQSPNTGFYLGYDMPRPQLPPCMVTDLVWNATDKFMNYERSATVNFTDNKSLLLDLNSNENIEVSSEMKPSILYAMPVKGQTIRLNGSGKLTGTMELWKSQAGTLVANIPLAYTGTTYISEGTLEVNGEIPGKVDLRSRGTLAGQAIINDISFEGALHYEGCRIAPNTLMTFKKGLTLNNTVYMEMDIVTSTGKQQADLLKIEGDLTLSTPAVFTIIPAEKEVTPGKFKLIEYTGKFIGEVSDFLVDGLVGLSYNIINEGNAIYLVINEQRKSSTGVMWNGNVNGEWNYQTKNFLLNNVETEFVAQDEIEFTDEAVTTTITVNELMPVGKTTFKNYTKNYSFNGDGGFSGKGQLIKNGNGRLTLNTTKSDYTGATIINEGTVVVKELADGGIPSSLGAASSSADNLQIGKATLTINNSNTSTNRGITLTDTATIQIASGATSFKGLIKGKGTLLKSGGGQLNITYSGANTWSGGTILKGGTLAMGSWNTTFGVSTSPISVNGNSTICIFDNNSTSAVPTLNNHIEVLKGKTLTIIGGSRCKIQGRLSGEGTVKISFPYVRGDVSTNMSEFTGLYNVTSGQLRLTSSTNLAKGTLKLDGGVYVAHNKSQSGDEQNLTSMFGALESTATDCTLSTGTYNIGYNDANTTYAGVFNNNATINKYGNGELYLTGTSQGKVNIYGGTLSIGNTTKETTTGMITVNEGGTLAGTGKASSVTIQKGGIITSGRTAYIVGTMTLTGSLNVRQGGIFYIRVRGTSSIRNDAFDVKGNTTLISPIFRLERTSGEFAAGDEIKIFKGDGKITLSGEATIEPAIPLYGHKWDTSTLTTDGTIRVVVDPVGIDNVEADRPTEQIIYDLSGRKVKKADTHGIYIINGEKTIK